MTESIRQVIPASQAVPQPRRIVAMGGGTGLPVVLRGLKQAARRSDGPALTGVVTVTDDGGSSGRLRKSLGVPPPGDIRNCLVALAEEEDLLAGIFQHRYTGSDELRGHALGNLILAALAEQTGCFLKAVQASSRVLRVVGEILPTTMDNVELEAVLDDGTTMRGETAIASVGSGIRQIRVQPRDASPAPGVVEAILAADLIVIGPGSLYTSLLPVVAVSGIAAALRKTKGKVILVANLVSKQGEAPGLGLQDHVRAIESHAGAPVIDGVLSHRGPFDDEVLERYRLEGASPLIWRDDDERHFEVVAMDLVDGGRKLRHDPGRTVAGVLDLWRILRQRLPAGQER